MQSDLLSSIASDLISVAGADGTVCLGTARVSAISVIL